MATASFACRNMHGAFARAESTSVPTSAWWSERAGMAPIDGDNGMGHLVMTRAAALAVEKARMAGVAWVGTRN